MTIPKMGRVEIIRGQALDICIKVPADVDLTGSSIVFGISNSVDLGYHTILPTTWEGDTITAFLSGNVSSTLTLSTYYYSCWIDIGNDPTPTVRGSLTLTKDSRNK